MLPSSRKLNRLQRGILQKYAVACVYMISVVAAAYAIDWLDKSMFLDVVEQAHQQGSISEKVAKGFTILIESRSETDIFKLIFAICFCGSIGFFFMRWTATLLWSWPVALPKAVEFKQAMQNIGINTPEDRIDFVRKKDVPVFIASSPFSGLEQKDVHARLYPFATNMPLGNSDMLNKYIGEERLCLDIADYEYLCKEYSKETLPSYASRISSLEKSLTNLQGTISVQQEKINKLTEENQILSAEKAEYKKKERTLSGREKSIESRENVKLPFRRIAYPLVNRLIAEAGQGTKYTRTKIQEEFLWELKSFPELTSAVQRALQTPKKVQNNTPFDLTGWGMEEIRLALGEYAQKDPGRDKES